MTKTVALHLPTPSQPVLTLAGHLDSHSTRHLHVHEAHQVLHIRRGVSLLVDESRKQPLFAGLTAFIPAGRAHRSTVMGAGVDYKSLYLLPELFTAPASGIIIFRASALEENLLERIDIQTQADLHGLTQDCLNLFLKLLPKSLGAPAPIVRLPLASSTLTREIVSFIESSHARPLTMDDFTAAFPYSARHLSRLFREDLGLTMFEYLRLYRILQAAIALGDESRTIIQCAVDAGYEAQSTFYHDFREIHGVSPKVFRQRILGTEADGPDGV
jgi:AraC-like DNA-binding protein